MVGSTVQIIDSTGKVVAETKTGANAGYTLTVPAGTQFPLRVKTTGGIDQVTGEKPTDMDSLVVDAKTTTANVTPLTTVITHAAIAASGGALDKVSAATVTTATKTTVDKLGFGVDAENANIDPIATPLTATNIVSVTRASEAVAETVRRVAGTDPVQRQAAMATIGTDLSDGKMDGKNSGQNITSSSSTLSATQISASVAIQTAVVSAEVIGNNLTLTKTDGTQMTSAEVNKKVGEAVATVQPTVSAVAAEKKMTELPVSAAQKSQAVNSVNEAIALSGSSNALTTLKDATDKLVVGQAGQQQVAASATNAAKEVTKSAQSDVVSGKTSETQIVVAQATVKHKPIASAGKDQSVASGATVTLTGSAYDAGGTIDKFQWVQTHGTQVALAGSNSASATFTAPIVKTNETLIFRLTVFHVEDETDSATVNIHVKPASTTPTNTAPVAASGTLSVVMNTATSGTLSATDADGHTLTYTIVSNGSKGTVSVTNSGTGAYTYTPTTGATGADSFTFKASDSKADSNTATITITISDTTSTSTGTSTNNAPIATSGTLSVIKNTATSGTLTATDADGNTLTYTIVSNGSKGTVSVTNSGTGAYTYTPTTGATGADSFTFKASDSKADSNTATITITISDTTSTSTSTGTSTNNAPVATSGTLSVTKNTATSGTLVATDGDNNTLTYAIVTNGSNGTVSITNAATGAYTYTPNSNVMGADSFTFKVNDGTADSNTATVTVTISGTTGTPTLSMANVTVTEADSTTNATLTVTLSAAVTSAVTVQYGTGDGTAVMGRDYTYTVGTLTIPAGSTTGTFTVPIIGDNVDEATKTFMVTIHTPTGATIANDRATVTILDDDPGEIGSWDKGKWDGNKWGS
ncbi:MAG: Ig-like domain-containing protein [Magnetococcus sp. DMHC-1]